MMESISGMNQGVRSAIASLFAVIGLLMALFLSLPFNLLGLIFVAVSLIFSISILREVVSKEDDAGKK